MAAAAAANCTSRCGADHPMPINRYSRDYAQPPSSDACARCDTDALGRPAVSWRSDDIARTRWCRFTVVASLSPRLVSFRSYCMLLMLIAAVRPGDRIINAYLVGADDHTAIATSQQSWRRDRWRVMVGWCGELLLLQRLLTPAIVTLWSQRLRLFAEPTLNPPAEWLVKRDSGWPAGAGEMGRETGGARVHSDRYARRADGHQWPSGATSASPR